MHDDAFKRPGTGLQEARALIDRFENSRGRRNLFRKFLKRGMQSNSRADWIGSLRKRFGDELGEVSFGRFARLEANGDFGLTVDAIDTEGAPIVASAVPCDEVPAGSSMDEAVGFDGAHGWRAGAVLIFETEAFAIAAGASDRREQIGVDARSAAAFEWDDESMKSGDALTETRRKDLLEFEKGADRGLFDAGDAALRRGAQAEGNGDGLVIIEEKRWKRGAGSELISAFHAGGGVDGIAEAAKAIDIATKSATRDLETSRKFGSRPVALSLEQGEQAKQAGRGVQHGVALCHKSRTDSVLNS